MFLLQMIPIKNGHNSQASPHAFHNAVHFLSIEMGGRTWWDGVGILSRHRTHDALCVFHLFHSRRIIIIRLSFPPVLTIDQTAAEAASSGLTDKITKVNFHPWTNPIIMPVRKVAKNCTNIQILSPMPSWMVLMSLEIRKEEKCLLNLIVFL